MAFYLDEEKVWKCAKHPSKRRRTGICPVCLQNKLASLCPDCAHTRPCACSATSCSSSSSSSYSCFSITGDVSDVGTVGRVSNLIETEPVFRRSRSLSIPFLRLKSESLNDLSASNDRSKTPSFWSVIKGSSTNTSKRFRIEDHRREIDKESVTTVVDERRRMTMIGKSRSVAMTSHSGIGDPKSSPSTKGKGWYFTNPMKVLRQSRVSKLVFRQHSPLYRS